MVPKNQLQGRQDERKLNHKSVNVFMEPEEPEVCLEKQPKKKKEEVKVEEGDDNNITMVDKKMLCPFVAFLPK